MNPSENPTQQQAETAQQRERIEGLIGILRSIPYPESVFLFSRETGVKLGTAENMIAHLERRNVLGLSFLAEQEKPGGFLADDDRPTA